MIKQTKFAVPHEDDHFTVQAIKDLVNTKRGSYTLTDGEYNFTDDNTLDELLSELCCN